MRRLAVLTVGAALFLASCGDDDSDSVEPFVADADAICTELAEDELVAFAASAGPETSVDYLEQIRDQRAEALDRLEALEVPDESASVFDDYVAKLEQSKQVTDEAAAAAAEQRADEFAAARVEARNVRAEANEIGAGLGFSACAGVLTAEDQAQVTETLELTIDPEAARELCSERSTEAFIATRFESVADCAKAQAAETPVETVTVTELQGVEGVSANVLLELGSAKGDSVEYEASLAYEDGAWKLNSIAPTSPTG